MVLSASSPSSKCEQRGDAADNNSSSKTQHGQQPNFAPEQQPEQLSASPSSADSASMSSIPQRLNTQNIQQPSMPQFATSPTSDSEETSTPIAFPDSNDSHHIRRWQRPQFHNTPSTAEHDSSDTSAPLSSRPPSHQSHSVRGWLSTRAQSYSSQQSEQSMPSPSSSRDETSTSWAGMLKNMVGGGRSEDTPGTSSASHSRHTSREYKETLDAHTKDEKDGTRVINQYHLVKVIGSGTYGVVYKCCLRDDPSQLFAAKEFSKTRLKKSKRHETFRRPNPRSRGGSSNPNAGAGLRGRGLGHTQQPGRPSEAGSAEHNNESSDDAEKDPLRLIRREIAIMKKLTHPNVINLVEALDDPSRDELYMILEFCPDGPVIDIRLHERTQPLNEETARSYFIQILLGIEYLHHNDIIHRDIKPDNILLCDSRRTCKIVDFGVSEMFDQGTQQDRKGQGTPAFLSPELCSVPGPRDNSDQSRSPSDPNALREERESNGRRDDMWALGVTLYCMVVGHLPFDKSHFMELYDAIKEQEPEYPSHLTPKCVNLLKRFLNKDPKQRIDIEGARAHPWVTAEGHSAILPATENLKNAIHDITEDELQCAIARISSVWTVARAVSKFKLAKARGSMRSASSQSQTSDAGDAGSGFFDSQQSAPPESFLPDWQTTRDSPLQSPRIPMSAPLTRQNTASEGELSRDCSRLNLADYQKGSGSESGGQHYAKRPSRSQPLSRQASAHAPPSIEEHPEEHKAEGKQADDAESASVSRSVGKVVSDVSDTVAGLAHTLVTEPGELVSDRIKSPLQSIGGPSGLAAIAGKQSYSQAMSDTFSKTLKSLESTFETRMHGSDPVAAKKHLANHLQQQPPLERLKQGLKGMGLDLFGWAEEKTKGAISDDQSKDEDKDEDRDQQDAAESTNDSRQQAQKSQSSDLSSPSSPPSHSRVGLSAIATDAAHKLLSSDRDESDDQEFKNAGGSQIPGSLHPDELKEDEEGRNVHTGRSREHGQASSGATQDLDDDSAPARWHRSTNKSNDKDADQDTKNFINNDVKRLFEGPLVNSPHREDISRDFAARTLGGGDTSPREDRPDHRQESDSTVGTSRSHDGAGEGSEASYGGNLSENMKHEDIGTQEMEDSTNRQDDNGYSGAAAKDIGGDSSAGQK